MVRYSKRVDMLCIRIPYLFFVAYLILLLRLKRPFATQAVGSRRDTSVTKRFVSVVAICGVSFCVSYYGVLL